VWLVELGALVEPDLLPDVVVRAVGAREAASLSPLERLVTFLRARRALIVLDNCEHMLDACAQLVETLVRHCPDLCLLATSREVLRSSYETVLRLLPLSLPATDLGDGADSPVAYLEAEAVQLFVQRATAGAPSFRLTPRNAPAVARICQQVDGLPLAIELAASCVAVLAPEQIAAQIEQETPILTQPRRAAVPRQQSLVATMDWSYRLLTPDEQALFRRLALLAGSFALDAAVAVGGGRTAEVLARLRRLIDASLVMVVEHNGAARYRMLETLRHFGWAQLRACGEEATAAEQYCDWLTRLVQAAMSQTGTADQSTALDRLEVEIEHVRAALRWLLEQGQRKLALRLASSLAPFWRQRGQLGEGRRWLEKALAYPAAGEPPSTARGWALNALGVLAMWQCDYDVAGTCHDEARLLFDALDDRSGAAWTHFRLGFLATRRSDERAARDYLARALREFAELGDEQGADAARNRLGVVAWNRGDVAGAIELLESSLTVQRRLGHRGGMAATLLTLGEIALEQGHADRATSLIQESLTLNRTLGDTQAVAYALTMLGSAALLTDQRMEAGTALHEALSLLDDDAAPDVLCWALDGMGTVLARQGNVPHAAQLWGAADALRRAHVLHRRPSERRRMEDEQAHAQHCADGAMFTAGWQQGASTPVHAVVTLARASWSTVSPATATLALSEVRPPRTERTHLLSAAAPSAALHLYGLGTVDVVRGTCSVTASAFGYVKARELLFYLMSHPPVTKEQIGLALWPDATPEYLRATFRVVLYHLRRALGSPDWIVRQQRYYTVDRTLSYWYDVETFDTAIQQALEQVHASPDAARTALEAAIALYRGDFWEGMVFSDWIVHEQTRLQHLFVQALLALAELYSAAGQVQRALQTFLRAAERDPFCETAHRGVIRSYLWLHEPGQAKRHFEQLVRTLHVQLGVRPAAETEALLFKSVVEGS
jgi:predicted ATPase/DNA-binding SARP family transcriptional activator